MEFREIELSQGKFAKVSPEDFERVNKFKWSFTLSNGKPYAHRKESRAGKRKTVFLHRFIMNAPKGLDVDHENGNGLDNRRENLRIATRSENLQNSRKSSTSSSRYKGIALNKATGNWRAQIRYNGKQFHIGMFDTDTEAAIAYDLAAKRLHGQFAYTNFLNE